MKKLPAPVYVILAAIGWGVIGIFTRGLSSDGMSVMQVAFARAFVTLIGAGIILFIFNRKALRINPKDIWIFMGTGILSVAAFNVCYFYTIEQTTLSIAAILLYTAPCFVILMSAIFFHEKITAKMLIALGLSLIGCVLTTGVIGSSVKIAPIGIVTGILSGFFYALYSIFGTIALKKYKTPTLVFYTFVFATLGLLPFAALGSFFRFFLESKPLIEMILIGLISTLLPYYFYSEGLSRMEAGKASIIAFIEPITATITGILVFHESLTLENSMGIALVFIATILLNLKSKKTG